MAFSFRSGNPVARLLFCLGLLSFPTQILGEARGVSDPTVSWGLNGLTDWGSARPFLDIARVMRPFFAFAPDEWESMTHEDLRAGGYLDPNGYPLRIPPGMAGIRTMWDLDSTPGAEGRKGLYLLSYEGKGTFQFHGSAAEIAVTPGRIIFENVNGSSVWIDITSIDPGDPVRAISIVRSDLVDLKEAGAIFDPDWLALIADARELRFMDWMEMNSGRAATTWESRPKPGDSSWTDRGVPVEIMVRLANEVGSDPWFNMPHAADDAYVRAFATYVRDHLDPRLKAHVEYSNENWNAAFGQFYWLRDQAIAEWGAGVSEDWEAIFSYHTKRATEVALIWEEVFGAEAPARLVNILGSQTGNFWISEINLDAPGWQKHEPETYVAPSEVFEELALTSYFGGGLVFDSDVRRELLLRASSTDGSSYSWLFESLSQAGRLEDSIPAVLEALAVQGEQARSRGLRVVSYEGGQHVHHSFAVEGLSDAEAEQLSGLLGSFVRSPEMAALYNQLWNGWREVAQGPFMQFTEMGAATRWGSWGLLTHQGDQSPRASFVLARQAEGGSWWGEGGGPQYLQGVTAMGSEGADLMEGTDEEDFLAGLGGDDRFPASGGSDGIAGGEGRDVYVLPAPAAAYTISREDQGWRVTGPAGTAYLTGVEALEFGDGTVTPLD